MSTMELIAGISALLQVVVACYALWLNTRFGANRAGWALFGAFALMALLYVTKAWGTEGMGDAITVKPELVYLFISGLLLVGMSHVHEVFHERRRAEQELLAVQQQLEQRVTERTAELAKANQSLLTEVTRREQLETEFLHAQRMEALGQLAVGVAHDFNNILTVISGYTQLLIANAKPDDEENLEQLQQVLTAAERASNLTRQLLTFTRKQIMQAHPLDLVDVINDLTKLLRRIIGENIALVVRTADHLPLIHADSGMMGQILLNLAVNARDAMPEGGQLVIATESVAIAEGQSPRHPEARAGQFICLTVQDSGCGMSPETLARIFEPFFTTKPVGKGTGLGLATVYGIVKHHEGWVEVSSRPGRGTTFRIFLPRTLELKHPAESPMTGPKALAGTETILVVEDEPEVRNLARVILERYGYRVIEARSGVAALSVWEEHGQEIALLFTDMVMPDGLNGRELALELQQRQPSLKVIYTSGYSPGMTGEEFKIMEGINFMQKPYAPHKLALAVRSCLDGQPHKPALKS